MDGIDSEHLMALARQKTRESRSVLASTMATSSTARTARSRTVSVR